MTTARVAVAGQLLLCLAALLEGALVTLSGLLHDALSTVFDPHGELGGAGRAGAGAAVTGAVAFDALALAVLVALLVDVRRHSAWRPA